MQLNPLALSLLSAGMSRFSPAGLYADGSQGFWLDASDVSTLFQDSAGTTPVTALGDPVGRWLDKSGRGNHFVQTTSGARPVWGSWPLSAAIAGRVRNLLAFTEQFDTAYWTKLAATVTANAGVAPDGSTTAYKLIATESDTAHSVFRRPAVSASTTYTGTVYVKAAEYSKAYFRSGSATSSAVTFDLSSGSVISVYGSPSSRSITDVGNGWYRLTITHITASSAENWALNIIGYPDGAVIDEVSCNYLGDGVSGILVWGAQVEQSATATPYQRVGVSSRYDVSEAGQPQVYFVSPDGVDDFMVSAANVDFSATDRMFVCAGVTKKVEGSGQAIINTATDTTNGRFGVFAPTGLSANSANFVSRGTTTVEAPAPVGAFAAPISGVLSLLSEISPASLTGRVNGAHQSNSTSSQGSGTYENILRYIGSTGGLSGFLNANIYQIIAVGKTPTTSELNATETFVAQKTKGSLA